MGMLLITLRPPAGLLHVGKGGNIILDFFELVKVSLRRHYNIILPPCFFIWLSFLDLKSTCLPQGIYCHSMHLAKIEQQLKDKAYK